MIIPRCLLLASILVLCGQAPGHAQGDSAKLDSLTQKLKKDCEDQGGQFQLLSADAKHSQAPLNAPVEGRPGETSSGYLGIDRGGKTALQASGQCVLSFHMDAQPLPPSDAPREVLHLDPAGAGKP